MGAENQFVVVAYDIPDDKRRQKLHDLLQSYGSAVQYSVFECALEPKELARMKKAVAHVIKKRLDHVRYYYLCAACQKRIESTQGREETGVEQIIVV